MMNRMSISVASGKGGVGKTLSTVHIAASLGKLGRRVLLIDVDMGLANVDVVLGLRVKSTLNDVLEGRADLKDIVIKGPYGISIIPSGSGISRLADLSSYERLSILDQVCSLDSNYDITIFDTGAGISESVIHFNSISPNILVVTTPEPHALTDAYAFTKVMNEKCRNSKYHILVNMAKNAEEGHKVFSRLAEVAKEYLGLQLFYAGTVPYDPQLQKTIMARSAGSEQSFHSISGHAWNQIACRLMSDLCTTSRPLFSGLLNQTEGSNLRSI